MLTNNHKISVIIPVYNAEKYLSRCIESIIDQTYSNYELLLINDGSKDNSGIVCDEYATKDQRIRVFHKTNGGVSTARNLGLEQALGEYVMFVDADDWIECDCLNVLYNTIQAENLDLLQFSFRTVSENGVIMQAYSAETSVLNLNGYIEKDVFLVCVGGTIIKKSIIEINRLRFQEDLKLGEDQLFILSAMHFSKFIKRIPDVFYNYYQNENSATANAKFDDIINSIIALNNFQYKQIFKKHIDRMIVLQANVALNISKCNIINLNESTRNISINPIIEDSDNFNMKLLKYSWNKCLFFAFMLVRANYYLVKIKNHGCINTKS
ncbi:MAG: glycosyltransferase [Brumimicrobium sp.]|nr:glycosyltransferase [Brumimicrobium sp.]